MELHARPVVALFALLAAAALLTPAAAQGPAAPSLLLSDPAGDQAKTSGPLATSAPAFDNVDILEVTALEPAPGTLLLRVGTKAAASTTQNLTAAFLVAKGAESLPNSTASGLAYTLMLRAGAVSGIEGATVRADGTALEFTIPRLAIGAVGGDVLSNLTLSIEDFHPGAAPAPVTQDDSRASDVAPDSGSSTPYTFQRPAKAAGLVLDVLRGRATTGEGVACADGGDPCVATSDLPGASATVAALPARLQWELRITNEGLDPDTVALAAPALPGIDVSVAPATIALAPGESANATLTVRIAQAANGTIRIPLSATSQLGGRETQELQIHVQVPAPAPREPVPGQLGFLTPVVSAVGLDGVLGVYAELAFLLLVLLLVVVAVYLLLFLVKTPWVRVRVTPRKAVVAPGGVAEFRVELEGRKKRPALARATLRTEGAWTSGLQVGRDGARPGESMDIPLEGGKDAVAQEAVVRVQVPYDAPAHDRQELEFDVVPVDADGGTHPKHGSRAKVTVEAAAPAVGKYASAHDIRLAEVVHDPPDPRPGAPVRTTATIHNDGPALARLRLVLQKDGKAVAEETVDLHPHGSRAVVLPWTAGVGRNLVKVQVFLA